MCVRTGGEGLKNRNRKGGGLLTDLRGKFGKWHDKWGKGNAGGKKGKNERTF